MNLILFLLILDNNLTNCYYFLFLDKSFHNLTRENQKFVTSKSFKTTNSAKKKKQEMRLQHWNRKRNEKEAVDEKKVPGNEINHWKMKNKPEAQNVCRT